MINTTDCKIPPFNHWKNALMQFYTSCFVWHGLPDTIDAMFMEKQLMINGCVALFNEPEIGFVCLPAIPSGELNVYGYPANINVYGMNGYTNFLKSSDCVLCYDNIMFNNPCPDINLYAARLAELDKTIDINTDNQKTPYIVSCEENQKLTLANIFANIAKGSRAIFTNKKANIGNIDVVQTPAPYVADKLEFEKQKILMEAVNLMGIFSGESTKAERLTSGENAANVGFIKSARDSREIARQNFCDLVRNRFGLEISFNYRHLDIEKIAAGFYNIGGGIDGAIYNDDSENT